LRVGSGARVRAARGVDGTRRPAGGDFETERRGPARQDRGREEMAQRAIRCVDARTALGGVGLDVRGRVGAGGVEPGVRPGGGARQRELQEGSEEPGGPDGGRASRGERHC